MINDKNDKNMYSLSQETGEIPHKTSPPGKPLEPQERECPVNDFFLIFKNF